MAAMKLFKLTYIFVNKEALFFFHQTISQFLTSLE